MKEGERVRVIEIPDSDIPWDRRWAISVENKFMRLTPTFEKTL